MTPQQSQAISNLRFPLMLGVVLIHCVVIDPQAAWEQGYYASSTLINLFSWCLTSPCVPLFFAISGFLFFAKTKEVFTPAMYGQKLRSRARTLLVPYLFWNAVVLGYFAFMHRFTPGLINPEFNNVYAYSWQEWLRSFWDYPGGQPVCFQFWFLRDLITMVVLSPVVFVLAKYGKWYLPVLLSGLWIYSSTLFPHDMAITFFTIGASFGIHDWDFVAMAKKIWRYALSIWCICLIMRLFNRGGNGRAYTNLPSSPEPWCIWLWQPLYGSPRASCQSSLHRVDSLSMRSMDSQWESYKRCL